jgi:hypothetical protein
LTQGLDFSSRITWTLGSDLTRSKRAWVLKVKDGKLAPEELTPQEALKQKIDSEEIGLSTNIAYAPPLQPTTNLRQVEAKVEQTVNGPRLIGRVHAVALHNPPLEDLRIRVDCKRVGSEISIRSEDLRSLPTPMGWIEFNVGLPRDSVAEPSGGVYLEAYLTWPRPGIYRISNNAQFATGKPGPGKQ